MNRYALLESRKVRVVDFEEFCANAKFFEDITTRTVSKTAIGDISISTVFLGINHGFNGEDAWFETMVFGGEHNEYQERYETWADAEAGHEKAVELVRRSLKKHLTMVS